MRFTGRSRELGILRTGFDKLEAQCIFVSGPPGAGTSTLVRHASKGRSGLSFRCPPLPDPLIRLSLRDRIEQTFHQTPIGSDLQQSETTHESITQSSDATLGWAHLFSLLLGQAEKNQPFILTLDDAHRLTEARSRFEVALADALRKAQGSGIPFHVVLAGRAGSMPKVGLDFPITAPKTRIHVGPLPLRAAAPHLPGNEAHEKIRAYGVFGGYPGVLTHLDTKVTVGTNVRRLLLPDTGSLGDLPMTWLETAIQTPTRYIAVLESLSKGEAGWSQLSKAIPDLTKAGQIAPYLKKLSELRLIHAHRSLDTKPHGRNTRYALSDPFLAFWLRFILPWRSSERNEEIVPYYASEIRPRIRDHLQQVMAPVCRRHMEIDALETFGSNARDAGAIWNKEAEIPIAGTLGTGATYYGLCLWDPPANRPSKPELTPLEQIDLSIRNTRYGFGREQRLRVVFTGRNTPNWLRREAARRSDARIINAPDMLGDTSDQGTS